MKSFLYYRLVIFAALITCGVFTGSCRAETDILCPMVLRHLTYNFEDNICFSQVSVPACTEICHPVRSRDRSIRFSCIKEGDPSGRKTVINKVVSIPERCELTLPVAVKPDTVQ